MYLEEVERLASKLTSPGLTIDEVCRFLALEVFASWKPCAVYVGEITDDGYIAPVGTFGLPVQVVKNWGNFSLVIDAPLTDAVRNNEIVFLKREDAFERYPILINYEGIPNIWDTYIVCPTLPHGVFALTLNSVPRVDEQMQALLRTIGSLISFFVARNEIKIESYKPKHSAKRKSGNGALTERQLIIKGLMEKGYTNTAIAAEIGYSESLVRQETMAIYSTLHISGRKELLEGRPE